MFINKQRVELHTHTKMSKNSIVSPKELIKKAVELGMNTISITDYNSCQAFPEAFLEVEKYNKEHDTTLKMIYGTELDIIDNGYHFRINILVRNDKGLANLYRILSLVHTKFLSSKKVIKMPLKKVFEYREGLLIGVNCTQYSLIKKIKELNDKEFLTLIKKYDYVEIDTPSIIKGLFRDKKSLEGYIARIVRLVKKCKKLLIAVGNVHHLQKEDKKCIKVLLNKDNIPSTHLRKTEEMLEDFAFLNKIDAYKIVVENTCNIASIIEDVQIIKSQKRYPDMDFCDQFTIGLSSFFYAKEKYGTPISEETYKRTLPKLIEDRLNVEASGIINTGASSVYYIYKNLVNHANNLGYHVSTRGATSSVLMTYILKISKVNPLPPHYVCSACHEVIWKNNDKYVCGFDLPDKYCSSCNILMDKDGFNLPYETFLGADASIIPDIDINTSSDAKKDLVDYLVSSLGNNKVFRAGTISKLSENDAYDLVCKYYKKRNIIKSEAEKINIANKLVGVKKVVGMHPDSFIISPLDTDIEEFTPICYASDDKESKLKTTHADYYNLDSLLKVDLLVTDIEDMIKELGDLTNVNPNNISFNDNKVLMSLINKNLNIPYYNTDSFKKIMEKCSPKNFGDLIKVFGLALGNWKDSVFDLINEYHLDSVISNREDLFNYLLNNGLVKKDAYEIMNYVFKGKIKTDDYNWKLMVVTMKKAGIDKKMINQFEKISYLYPKGHLIELVLNSYILTYYKVYYPDYFNQVINQKS